ncbi:farnesyl cysteine-carboxyl methyltransferase [Hortaea werneckii]|nr:farnesyl cysteine-carboxyl methyltransferase [Hortaea werneckii]KAI7058470.1 farnesyl cysteine-carboxyl methyltransferase [Hortaea werneckii]KAI7206814.1 farnesyl cysteine-carboxyl methyltransferase [Hortaea werneckii]KAI7291647.1 farnesyl cysteine-carboxyl methyltransferase [Hortaea werneckii]KAI7376571.1 farnesyl cysteine-carboxyl methyltransferase [Hortaea werneckii]
MARKSTSSSAAPAASTGVDIAHKDNPSPASTAAATHGEPSETPVTYTKASEDSDDSPSYRFDFEHNRFQTRYRNGPVPYDPSLLPNGSRSLSSIGKQAFCLGLVFAFTISATAWLANEGYTIWRLPAFFSCLSIFHFLEFYTTATYNVPHCRAESFLIFSNGWHYNTAHALATLEIIISSFFPQYQSALVYPPYTIAVGFLLVFAAQVVRSVAMATAGTNFNHTPVQTRKEDHELVTQGIYSFLRHPSYFGFFWWALGTQVLVGNKVCLVGYLIVLWWFFYRRIIAEESTLVKFFGEDYENFRKRTPTGIPFIR